jgi:hypothetical protein
MQTAEGAFGGSYAKQTSIATSQKQSLQLRGRCQVS